MGNQKNDLDNKKAFIDSKLFYLSELINFDKSIQSSFAEKIIIEKRIRGLICNLFEELKVGNCYGYDKDRTYQMIKLFGELIDFYRNIQCDLIQRSMLNKQIFEILSCLDTILKINCSEEKKFDNL